MTTQPDYYAILQVHPEAEKEVIDAAYRKLAGKYHPDVYRAPDAEEKMKKINAAYEVLSAPIKRAGYDATRGIRPAPEAPPDASTRPRHRVWPRLMMLIVLAVLAGMVVRLGPRLTLLLAVVFVALWLLFALARPRR